MPSSRAAPPESARRSGRELAKRGAVVVLADMDGDRAGAVAESIRVAGGRAHARTIDVTDAAAVEAMVASVKDEHGRIDFMFNNAGISMAGEMRFIGLADWNRIIDINLRGVVHGVNAVYPIMLAQRSGHIVNTASINGLVPLPLAGPYNATKHAVVGLSSALRAEAAGLGVRVSTVCPGFIDTPMKDNMKYVEMDKVAGQRALPFRLHPPGRVRIGHRERGRAERGDHRGDAAGEGALVLPPTLSGTVFLGGGDCRRQEPPDARRRTALSHEPTPASLRRPIHVRIHLRAEASRCTRSCSCAERSPTGA